MVDMPLGLLYQIEQMHTHRMITACVCDYRFFFFLSEAASSVWRSGAHNGRAYTDGLESN